MSVITAEQCLGARAMLRLTREQLAETSEVAVATIADFETGRRQPHVRTNKALRDALEVAGAIFVDENGEGPGVRLRKDESGENQ